MKKSSTKTCEISQKGMGSLTKTKGKAGLKGILAQDVKKGVGTTPQNSYFSPKSKKKA